MQGACLCGTVRFELLGPVPRLYQCHCSLCRRQSGAAANAATIVAAGDFRWLGGEDGISSWVRESGFRSDFCTRCGSPVPNPLRGLPYVWVPAGLLDEGGLQVAAHLCVASKADWAPFPASGRPYEAVPALEELLALLHGSGHGMNVVKDSDTAAGPRIRMAAVADAPRIAAMTVALTEEISRRLGATHFDLDVAESTALCARLLAAGDYLALLAWVDGETVGFVGLSQSHALYAGGALGTLQEFYVAPPHRSAGVGAALLQAAGELAQARGWQRLEVCTPPLPEFEGSLRFYQRNGFEVTGGRKMKRLGGSA